MTFIATVTGWQYRDNGTTMRCMLKRRPIVSVLFSRAGPPMPLFGYSRLYRLICGRGRLWRRPTTCIRRAGTEWRLAGRHPTDPTTDSAQIMRQTRRHMIGRPHRTVCHIDCDWATAITPQKEACLSQGRIYCLSYVGHHQEA